MNKLISLYEDVLAWVDKYARIAIFVALILSAIFGIWTLFKKWIFLAVLIAAPIYIARHWKDLRRTRVEDWFNPIRWMSAAYGWFFKLMFPVHIVEQLILRMYDMECRKCVAEGACIHCGCDISKVYVPWDSCSQGNWGPLVESEKEYRKMREEFPVEISIYYPKELNP